MGLCDLNTFFFAAVASDRPSLSPATPALIPIRLQVRHWLRPRSSQSHVTMVHRTAEFDVFS